MLFCGQKLCIKLILLYVINGVNQGKEKTKRGHHTFDSLLSEEANRISANPTFN